MKYFFDTEFIEDGRTIDLLSIGIVAEDGREYYAQNAECKFKLAGDFVWRNVFPHLTHFEMSGDRSCNQQKKNTCSDKLTGQCHNPDCPWKLPFEIRKGIEYFCDINGNGKPEFWGYYADYDWVAFCQLFGRMVDLPKGYPFYCRDLKQLCVSVGDPELPQLGKGEHSAINDARWNKTTYEFLMKKAMNYGTQIV